MLGRHGGEEFLALLPDSTPDDAAVVAERVRLAIEMAEIPCRTASCSRSRRVSDVPAGQTTAQAETSRILSNADLALYAAKTSGRNCVVSGPVVPAPPQEERRKTASGGGFDSRL
ncbi:diguanylate cyclase [Rhizobium binae]|nr:diguanylate cyclase [Rhizobium binae]MBX4945994.1 diguanylate cyclase [Rhizobium binae]MBX4964630.1 diguanylate cyclase [Rhizobium binae]MBX4981439.1 diguanylate cyclase [Rhizobium binae]